MPDSQWVHSVVVRSIPFSHSSPPIYYQHQEGVLGCSEGSSTWLSEFRSPTSKNALSYELYRLSSCKLQISLFSSSTPTLLHTVPQL